MANDPVRSQREVFIVTLWSLLALTAFAFVFFLICGGMSVYILAVLGGLAGLCLLNYLLWGRSFSRQVAGEREEEELRSALEEEGRLDDPERPHHPG